MSSKQQQSTIDWDALWGELSWDDDHTGQTIQQRLQQRARQYAVPMHDETPMQEGNHHQVLAFTLGNERYAIDVMAVKGVRTISTITRVPGVPAFYRGVVNVRGQIMSVLDLRYFFDTPIGDRAPREVILAEAANLELAILAHHIEEVLLIPKHAIEPMDTPYAIGVTITKRVVIDCDSLFSDDRLLIGTREET